MSSPVQSSCYSLGRADLLQTDDVGVGGLEARAHARPARRPREQLGVAVAEAPREAVRLLFTVGSPLC